MILVAVLEAEAQQEMVFEIEIWKSAKTCPSREDLEKEIEKVAGAHHDLYVSAHNDEKYRARACLVAFEGVTCIASL